MAFPKFETSETLKRVIELHDLGYISWTLKSTLLNTLEKMFLALNPGREISINELEFQGRFWLNSHACPNGVCNYCENTGRMSHPRCVIASSKLLPMYPEDSDSLLAAIRLSVATRRRDRESPKWGTSHDTTDVEHGWDIAAGDRTWSVSDGSNSLGFSQFREFN